MGDGNIAKTNVVAVNYLKQKIIISILKKIVTYLSEQKVHQEAAKRKFEQWQNDKFRLETIHDVDAGQGELTQAEQCRTKENGTLLCARGNKRNDEKKFGKTE